MAYIAGTDRTQAVFLPEVLDDYVGADNPVRFLDAFVAHLDLATIGFRRAVPAETGRPGYDPGDLLRLYLYGYLHRICSSRRLEQETHRTVELMWLLRRLTPDFKTIADFRRDHPAALKGVGREFILLCRRLDLFGGELLAIDGSKFRAVNARDRSYTPARLATLQRDIDHTIARYLHELERQDEVEAGTEGPSADALREKIAALGLFTKDDFLYDRARDVYRCPAGETVTYRTTTLELGRTIKNYRTSVCGRCALKPRCTRNQDGRKLTRWVHEDLLEDMAAHLRRAPALLAQHKALSEHPFGTMKRVLNLVAVPRLLEAVA